MAETAHLAHAMPGRVRLRFPAARGHPHRLERLRRHLAAVDGVRHVDVHPRTGSVVVTGDLALESLRALGSGQDLFELELEQLARPLAEELARGLERLDEAMTAWSGGRLRLADAAVAALLATAVVQAIRGRWAGPAAAMLWYAASLALMTRRPHTGRSP